MCGIVAACTERDVQAVLIEGLKRLEYRGYDSAGMALIENRDTLVTYKACGKVAALEAQVALQRKATIPSSLGIAHTRWATHGAPSEDNAHPHMSGPVALVHNGIIENAVQLRERLQDRGYQFKSQTDTEVIVHLVHDYLSSRYSSESHNLLEAVRLATSDLRGAYALAVISDREPETLVVAKKGSPLVIGLGLGENFIASDALALRSVTDRFIYLKDGDLAQIERNSLCIEDAQGTEVERPVDQLSDQTLNQEQDISRGQYRHFMQKEIFEQPEALHRCLEGRLGEDSVLDECFGARAQEIFARTQALTIIACGTSYHAGLVAKHWLEEWAGIPVQVEVASEFRYRKSVVLENSLFVTISQSGETADTLAALTQAKALGYLASLTICNVANSSIVRESDLSLMTMAGPEIGVASTKAFTTQLACLQLLAIAVAKHRKNFSADERQLVAQLKQLPELAGQVLSSSRCIESIATAFADKNHSLFLGRGIHSPIAMEGALKLKEISYIHAEAYAAGELKHGPLALVDNEMPVVVVAPCDPLLEKLQGNMQEVKARGGQLFVLSDTDSPRNLGEGVNECSIGSVPESLRPILFPLPLQLLAYHVALLKGTDVDQPRNLAKSVTVE